MLVPGLRATRQPDRSLPSQPTRAARDLDAEPLARALALVQSVCRDEGMPTFRPGEEYQSIIGERVWVWRSRPLTSTRQQVRVVEGQTVVVAGLEMIGLRLQSQSQPKPCGLRCRADAGASSPTTSAGLSHGLGFLIG